MTSGIEPMHDDDALPHDFHLRAALRHAPDAEAQPPAALSEAILRQAREALRAGANAKLSLPRWRRWLVGWGAPGAMPWAGGFAGLLVATLVGVLWWREPVPPVREHDAAPLVLRDDAGAASAPAAPSQDMAERSLPAAPPPQRMAERSAPASVEPTREERRAATLRAAAVPRRPASAAAAARNTAPAAASPSVAAAAPVTPASAAADASPPPRPELLAKSSQPPSRDDAVAGMAQRARPAARSEPQAESARSAAIASAGPAATGPTVPNDLAPPDRAWLARLDAEALGRWQRHAGALPVGRVFRWPSDGQLPPRVTVVLTPAGAFWQQHAAGTRESSWFVALTAEQLERLGAP